MERSEHLALWTRPFDRIGHVLSRLEHLWHYYPAYTLADLVLEVTFAANVVKSDLPTIGMDDIEDIAYPEGHYFHGRHLEMGIDTLEEEHKDTPLPPVPIQTAWLGKVAAAWSKHPQMRLGQLLSHNASRIEERENNAS